MNEGKNVSTKDLGKALGVTPRAVEIRAGRENWNRADSGRALRFRLDELPPEVQAAWLRASAIHSYPPTENLIDDRFDALDDKKKAEARRKLSIIVDFEGYAASCGRKNRTKARKDFCQIYKVNHPTEHLSPFTLRDWEKRLRETGLVSLAPNYGKTRVFASWPEEAKAFLRQLYLNENQPTARSCIAQTRLEASKQNWTLPSNETMQRFLSQIPQDKRDYYRRGEKFWRQTYIPSVLRDYESLRPGEIYVADHRQLDLACRFPDGGIRRPWITAVLDMRARLLVGWHIDSIPSTATILLALKHAFEEFGLPDFVQFDNGRDFSSRLLSGGNKRFRLQVDKEEFLGTLLQLGIKVLFALPANARAKLIERWFQVMRDFEVAFPTYLSNKVSTRPPSVDSRIRRGENVPDLDAVCDGFKNFSRSYNQAHCHSGHGMDGRTPLEVWNAHFENNKIVRPSPESLRLLLMKGSTCKVNRFGVTALNSIYKADELVGMVGQQCFFKYDPDDLQKLFLYKPDGAFVCEAVKLVRTAWNDETQLVELKRLEKQRRRAIRSEREADEALYQIRQGYRPKKLSEEKASGKIVEMRRTPVDGVSKKLEQAAERKAAAKAGSSRFEDFVRENYRWDAPRPEPKEVPFLRLNWGGKEGDRDER